MARTKRSNILETRTQRLSKLKPAKRPHWVPSGLKAAHLGYRRNENGNGTWIARQYVGNQRYTTKAFAEADDYADADGTRVMTYHQAIDHMRGTVQAEPRARSRYTIAQAVADYIAYQRAEKRSASDSEPKLRTYVTEFFGGERQVTELTEADFMRWRKHWLEHAPQKRRNAVKLDTSAEGKRRRKATLNRVIGIVKGCFNYAHAHKATTGVRSAEAWQGLKKFEKAGKARVRWLQGDEAQRLINASAPDFRSIVQGALLIGARWSELRGIRVRDFDPAGTVHIVDTFKHTARHVPLNKDGVALLTNLTTGRAPDDYVFTRADGEPWALRDQHRAMADACAAAKLEPVTFHELRHTYASVLVKAGVPLAYVAKATGHRDTRMLEEHYAHLAPSHVADTIRENLPGFNLTVEKKVRRIRA
jgi:integrase